MTRHKLAYFYRIGAS